VHDRDVRRERHHGDDAATERRHRAVQGAVAHHHDEHDEHDEHARSNLEHDAIHAHPGCASGR
jgi:hypothetical protein